MSGKNPKRQSPHRRRPRKAPEAPRRPHEVGGQELPQGSLDAGGAAGQNREAGSEDRSSPYRDPGEDGDTSPFTFPGSGAPAVDPQGHLTRPYRFLTALDLPSAVAFCEWVRQQANQPLGFAVGPGEALGFANHDIGWHVSLDQNDPAGAIVRSNLWPLLWSSESPLLIVQDASAFSSLSLDFPLIGDVALLRRATGHISSATPSWPSPADKAYDAFVSHAHWERGAPQFYKQVAVPRARQKAALPRQGTPWRLVYQDLLLRVIAHYTREPTLVAAFMDGEDPVGKIANILDLDEEAAYSALLWAAIGFDSVFLEGKPEIAQILLSDGLTGLRGVCERKFSVLAMSVIQQREDYIRNREMKTWYGQRIPWNLSIADMILRRYLMTAEEILDIVCVSFFQDAPLWVGSIEEEKIGMAMAARSIRVRGTCSGSRLDWQSVLEDVAPLGGPLSVPLAPTVIWGE